MDEGKANLGERLRCVLPIFQYGPTEAVRVCNCACIYDYIIMIIYHVIITHMYTCMYICMYMCWHTCAHVHAYVHIRMCTYNCIYMHIYVHAHMYRHMCEMHRKKKEKITYVHIHTSHHSIRSRLCT